MPARRGRRANGDMITSQHQQTSQAINAKDFSGSADNLLDAGNLLDLVSSGRSHFRTSLLPHRLFAIMPLLLRLADRI